MVMASWCAARLVGPCAVTTSTVARMAARRDRVRSMSQLPTRDTVLTPAQSGRSPTPWRRAARTTMTRYTAAMPHWAMTVPSGGAANGEIEAVDQNKVHDDVDGEAGRGHQQGCFGVLQPAQDAHGGHDQEHGGKSRQADQ